MKKKQTIDPLSLSLELIARYELDKALSRIKNREKRDKAIKKKKGDIFPIG